MLFNRQMYLPVPVPSAAAQQAVRDLLAGGSTLRNALQSVCSQGMLSKPPLAGWKDVSAEAAAVQAATQRAAQLTLPWPLLDEEPAEEARRAVWMKRRPLKL